MKLPFSPPFSKSNATVSRDAINRRIGGRLATLISERATNPSQLAEKAGIPETALRSYIEGTRKLPSSESMMLASALGITLGELYSGLSDS